MYFFRFSFQAFLSFYVMNVLVYVDINQAIHKKKLKNARNEKRKKLHEFSDIKIMANFAVFYCNFSSSTNPQIVRSENRKNEISVNQLHHY